MTTMTTHTDLYNTVYIDCAALQHNFQALQAVVTPRVRLLAMVKSDAYGHGLVHSAKALSETGANAFGIAEVDEGVALREAGIQGDIFVFLGSYCFAELIEYGLTPVVFDLNNIRALSAYAEKRNTTVAVHLKIDTGMGRLGVMPDEISLYIDEITKLPGVSLAGVLSHFPMADQPDSPTTMNQNVLFDQECDNLNSKGAFLPKGTYHIANSAALLNFPETRHQMVRPGISLYGCYPSVDPALRNVVSLKPVMSFATKIVQLKTVPADYGVSYGHLSRTARPSRLAILPVGYADGYLRSLTGKASVIVRGQRAPVCGRVCMNATVVDVTDISAAEVGDEVVLMGSQAFADHSAVITADEIAGWMETINYEVLCLFGNSNQRIYR
nr:alanine racemase [Desulfobulbaceae bacterium]